MTERRREGGLLRRFARGNGGHTDVATTTAATPTASDDGSAGTAAGESEYRPDPPPPPPPPPGWQAAREQEWRTEPERTSREPERPGPEAERSEPDPANGGSDERDRPRIVGPLESFLRHPLLVLIPVILLLADAVYIGVSRDPEYTAQSRINVGRADVPPFYLQQVTTGNEALAAGYARAIYAPPVGADAARQVRVAPEDVRDRLKASHVPGSTLIEVEAEGESSDEAIALANAGSRSLIRYIDRVTQSDESPRVLRRYRDARRDLERAENRVESLARDPDRNRRALARAELAADAARLKTQNLADRYRDASIARANRSQLSLLAPAAGADSDEREVLERLVVIALVGGLLLGLALALLRTNWRVLKALRRG